MDAGRRAFRYRDWTDVKISLAGSYQIWNASLALEAAWALQRMGIQSYGAADPGRTAKDHLAWPFYDYSEGTVCHHGWCTHNPAAAQTLRDSLRSIFRVVGCIMYSECFRDKDLSGGHSTYGAACRAY